MFDYMPKEIFALRIDPVEETHVVPLPRMYSRAFETGYSPFAALPPA